MNLQLQSQRLVFTPYTPDDLDLTLEMFTDPAVVGYAGAVMNEATVKSKMSNRTMRGGNGCSGIWAVSDRSTGEKYGCGALLPMPVDVD